MSIQKRLDELAYTHDNIDHLLQQAGVRRTLAEITSSADENATTLFELKALANILKWSLLELLVVADYELEIQPELHAMVKAYNKFSQAQRELLQLTVEQFSTYIYHLGEDEVNRALQEAKQQT